MKKLLLVGSDDTHLPIINTLDQEGECGICALLVTSSPFSVDRLFSRGWQQLDVLDKKKNAFNEFMRSANIKWVVDELVALDVESNTAVFRSGHKFNYDVVSLNTDYETDTSQLATLGERLLPVKPSEQFFKCWQQLLIFSSTSKLLRLVVVGDDLSALHIAVAACDTMCARGVDYRLALVVAGCTESQLLATPLRDRINELRRRQSLQLHCAVEAAGTNTGVILSNGVELYADRVIVASKTRPPPWLEITQLSRNSDGLVIVDEKHRSVSHTNVFASGDMIANG